MASRFRPSRSSILGLLLLVVFAILAWTMRGRIHFDWHALGRQLRLIAPGYLLAGLAVIYSCYWMRALRWAILVGPVRPTTGLELLGCQFIGFTALVLVGRIADLVRPYLIARRLRVSVASQLAVYSLERAFDLGAAAALFSFTLAVAPRDIPHHAAYVRAGALSLAATVGIALFALSLRSFGDQLASLARRLLHPISETFAQSASERLLDFRDGLRSLTTLREFLAVSGISLTMWTGIAVTYLLTARAFVGDPVLAHFGFTATMLMLATSLGGSLVQLPVVGWFTQIGLLSAAFVGFFGVSVETATACSAMLFVTLSLSVVPAGLISARLEGTSLGKVMRQSNAVDTATEA